MPAPDPDTRAHLEWLGFIQPNGLVVSAPALVKAGVVLNRHDAEGQSRLAGCISERELHHQRDPEPCIRDFREFATSVLGWGFSSRGYAGTDDAPIPPELEVPLPDYGETLRPDFAVRERDPHKRCVALAASRAGARRGPGLRRSGDGGGTGSRLEASPQGRAERLLRATGVPAGLLFNGTALRLISAPRGESSGWMDFRVADMIRTAGRPLCAALRLLLSEQRLLALPRGQRLAALLEDSRKYQNEVSERLSEQVMHALYELLRGLQAAHDASGGGLLRGPLSPEGDRNDIYRGLLSVILRLVFLLYAEERGVLPENETFVRHYSLAGLYQRLREDAALHPDTMDQRFGAWAQLLVLFRLIHDGARDDHTGGAVSLPERRGALFDPDRFASSKGAVPVRARAPGRGSSASGRRSSPTAPCTGCWRSCSSSTVNASPTAPSTWSRSARCTRPSGAFGWRSRRADPSPSSPRRSSAHRAPSISTRYWRRGRAAARMAATAHGPEPDGHVAKGLRAAETVEDLQAALDRVLDKDAPPDLVPAGALVLQPNEERRRSGSHYTPRELTEPIVRHTLAPILDGSRRDRRAPTRAGFSTSRSATRPWLRRLPGRDLPPACRRAHRCVGRHGREPVIRPRGRGDPRPASSPEVPVRSRPEPDGGGLAKVSLWLSTLARDHPLTFVTMRSAGDSLVGLSRRQIEAFHWLGTRSLFRRASRLDG